MTIKAILFDLDGTLLPMVQEQFIAAYFGELVKKLMPYGFDKDALIGGIWSGTKAMVKNDGSVINEKRFWDDFTGLFGEKAKTAKPLLDDFYANEFQRAASSCGFDPDAKPVIDALKKAGYRLILATNPIFPAVATLSRISWAGLSASDFEHITTYENAHYCKPNPAYYKEILSECGLAPEECLMVGNDVDEDMIAKELGMQVFLLPRCLINKVQKDISEYPSGDLKDLMAYLAG